MAPKIFKKKIEVSCAGVWNIQPVGLYDVSTKIVCGGVCQQFMASGSKWHSQVTACTNVLLLLLVAGRGINLLTIYNSRTAVLGCMDCKIYRRTFRGAYRKIPLGCICGDSVPLCILGRTWEEQGISTSPRLGPASTQRSSLETACFGQKKVEPDFEAFLFLKSFRWFGIIVSANFGGESNPQVQEPWIPGSHCAPLSWKVIFL